MLISVKQETVLDNLRQFKSFKLMQKQNTNSTDQSNEDIEQS